MFILTDAKVMLSHKTGREQRPAITIIRCFLFLLVVFQSCGPIKEVVTPDPTRHTLNQTLTGMRQNETRFDFLNTRFSGSASIDGIQYSVSGTIRIKKDSTIFVSVAPLLGIEIARLLITPDTVKMVNRLDNTFYVGNMEILNRMFNTHLDYYMLQALLIGNDFSHFSSEGFSLSRSNGNIVLISEKRRPLKNPGTEQFQHKLLLSGETFRIKENLLYEKNTQRSLQVRYHSFSRVENQFVPRELSVIFSGIDGQAGASLHFSRTVLNEARAIVFSIPEHYRQIQL